MQVTIVGRPVVDRLLRTEKFDLAVSIRCPNHAPLSFPAGTTVFLLQFDDAVRNSGDWPERFRYVRPSDLAPVLKHAATLDPDARVLVHCLAGLSRSPAVALGLFAARQPTRTMRAAYQAMQQMLDAVAVGMRAGTRLLTVYPNADVVAVIDDLLGYGGALTRVREHTFYGLGFNAQLSDAIRRFTQLGLQLQLQQTPKQIGMGKPDELRCPWCNAAVRWSCSARDGAWGQADCQDGGLVSYQHAHSICNWAGSPLLRFEGEVYVPVVVTPELIQTPLSFERVRLELHGL